MYKIEDVYEKLKDMDTGLFVKATSEVSIRKLDTTAEQKAKRELPVSFVFYDVLEIDEVGLKKEITRRLKELRRLK